MTVRFGDISSGAPFSASSVGGNGSSFSFTWEHPVAWTQLRKYFEKTMGDEESKKLVSILESNAKSLEDFLDVAYLKADGGSVFGETNFTGNVNFTGYVNVPPPGTVVQWAGASTFTAPDGWLFADGSEWPIAQLTNLYNALTNNGTVFPYGANTNGSGGAGSTHFRVPNLVGRIPVGIDPAQTEFNTMGETGGAKTHTLSTSEIPSHSHTVIGFNGNPAAGTNPFGIGLLAVSNTGYNYDTGNTGGGGAHNNLQPYIVLNYLIKH